jgi:hypothetical protein
MIGALKQLEAGSFLKVLSHKTVGITAAWPDFPQGTARRARSARKIEANK